MSNNSSIESLISAVQSEVFPSRGVHQKVALGILTDIENIRKGDSSINYSSRDHDKIRDMSNRHFKNFRETLININTNRNFDLGELNWYNRAFPFQIFPKGFAKRYEKEGFISNDYFLFPMNPRDPRVQARLGNLDLTPTTFEQGTNLLSLDQYRRVIGALKRKNILAALKEYGDNGYSNREFSIREYTNPTSQQIGWSAAGINWALTRAGLKTDIPGNSYEKKSLPFTALGPEFNSQTTDLSYQRALPGFRFNAYMPTAYYQSVYRKIFGTLAMVNWLAVIEKETPTLEELRFVAVNDFSLPSSSIQHLPRKELCQLIESVAEPRRQSLIEKYGPPKTEVKGKTVEEKEEEDMDEY